MYNLYGGIIIEFRISKQNLIKIVVIGLTLIITVFLPILGYLQFKNSLENDIDLGDLEARYDLIIVWIVIIGILITVCSYLIFSFPKYSVNRGILSLINSILDFIFICFYSQMSIIYIEIENLSITLNLMGVFILIIVIWSLFIFKNLFDLIDFKRNRAYYDKIRRNQKKATKKLLECPECKYMCVVEWRKCPICNAQLMK